MEEEKIVPALITKFGLAPEQTAVKRARRIFVTVDQAIFRSALEYLIKEFGFNGLSTITGMDSGDNFEIIYHLSKNGGLILNLKILVPKTAGKINTIIDLFPVAEMYEREIVDLLGMAVEGLSPGRRYPLPDTWPTDQHPLLKNWKLNEHETGGQICG